MRLLTVESGLALLTHGLEGGGVGGDLALVRAFGLVVSGDEEDVPQTGLGLIDPDAAHGKGSLHLLLLLVRDVAINL